MGNGYKVSKMAERSRIEWNERTACMKTPKWSRKKKGQNQTEEEEKKHREKEEGKKHRVTILCLMGGQGRASRTEKVF